MSFLLRLVLLTTVSLPSCTSSGIQSSTSERFVPTAVRSGDPVWLNCTFNLESDELYSLKWYKNNVEFYRYLPSDDPPAQKYDLSGVYVDLYKSSLGHVYLTKTDLNTEGTYRCEASAEAPSFQTERAERELRVYVLPAGKPTIVGTNTKLEVGKEVNVTCIAQASKPAASLRWFLNDEESPSSYLWHPPIIKYTNDLISSRLGLYLTLTSAHLQLEELKLKCLASIFQAYSITTEEVIVGNSVRPSGYFTTPNGPTIDGGLQPRYKVGDTMNLNCTSALAKRTAELSWYINDIEVDPTYLVHYPPRHNPDNLVSTVMGLKFKVRANQFQKGEIRLKCTSTLFKIIDERSVETVIGGKEQSSGLHISESSSSVHDGAMKIAEPLKMVIGFIYVIQKWM
ncbi:uncharacterized protein LOC143231289 [Tachypleus tridentatus]|uniref:uncharacterized protein LOC143231289 n=1 Tax=Tachypleus tridentatus TaxID=6853 RepID=UPI003FD50337